MKRVMWRECVQSEEKQKGHFNQVSYFIFKVKS